MRRFLLFFMLPFLASADLSQTQLDAIVDAIRDVETSNGNIIDLLDIIGLDTSGIADTDLPAILSAINNHRNESHSDLVNLRTAYSTDFNDINADLDWLRSNVPLRSSQNKIVTSAANILTATRAIQTAIGTSTGDNVLSYLQTIINLLQTNNIVLSGVTNGISGPATNLLSGGFELTNFVANYIFSDDWQTMLSQSAPANAGEDSIWETLSLLGNSLNAYYNESDPYSSMKIFPDWVLTTIPDGGYVTPSMLYGSHSALWPEMQLAQFHFMVSNSALFAGFDPRRIPVSGAARRHWVNQWGDYDYFTQLPITGPSHRTTNKGYLFTDWLADFLKMSAYTNTLRNSDSLRYLDSISTTSSNILDNVSTNGFGEPSDLVTNSWEDIEEFQPPTLWGMPEWSENSVVSHFSDLQNRFGSWASSGLSLNVSSNDASSVHLVLTPAITRFGISENVFNFTSSIPRVCGVVHTVLGALWVFLGVMHGLHSAANNLRDLVKAC